MSFSGAKELLGGQARDGRCLPHPGVGHGLPAASRPLWGSRRSGRGPQARLGRRAGAGPWGCGQAGCAAAPQQPGPSGQWAPRQQPGPPPAMPLARLQQSRRWHAVPGQGCGPPLPGTAPQRPRTPAVHQAGVRPPCAALCQAVPPRARLSPEWRKGLSCRGRARGTRAVPEAVRETKTKLSRHHLLAQPSLRPSQPAPLRSN